jgi:fructoselysine-6-P-deglycase FrlB-like protein
MFKDKELTRAKIDIQAELNRLEANQTAKEIAGKSIGRFGLFYITLIVLIGVGSSYFLSESAITAVMTMIGGALVALINMMNGIAGTKEKEEKPEFKVIDGLIQRLDQKEPPMQVTVDGEKVIVSKGHDTVTMNKENS